MEFCPKCGAILVIKKKNSGCPRCSYSSKTKLKIKSMEKIDNSAEKKLSVVKEKDTEILPKVYEKCKKCGNEQAFFWTVQTRSGDEAETKFFKCVKCAFTWREYR